jgi:hypothetical protein
MQPDRDRAELYAAELSAFDGTDLESVVGFSAVSSALRDVVDGSWWPGPAVVVRRARSDARTSTTRCSSSVGATTRTMTTTIRFAPQQTTIATAAHELAHALAGPAAGHDASFRRAYLDIVAVITNRSSLDRRGDLHVEQLHRAFESAGLSIAPRRWPSPPSAVAGPIAL